MLSKSVHFFWGRNMQTDRYMERYDLTLRFHIVDFIKRTLENVQMGTFPKFNFAFSAGAGDFSLHHRVQNGSGAHPASYPVGTRGSFPGCKAAGA
jgi:hypothetical protein